MTSIKSIDELNAAYSALTGNQSKLVHIGPPFAAPPTEGDFILTRLPDGRVQVGTEGRGHLDDVQIYESEQAAIAALADQWLQARPSLAPKRPIRYAIAGWRTRRRTNKQLREMRRSD